MSKANKKTREQIPEEIIWFYHKKGFSIIPLGKNKGYWGNNENELKRPSLRSWEKYKTTQATQEEIQQWYKDKLFNNIAIVCGHVSNDLVIIDIDDETLFEIIDIKIKKIIESGAWIVKTGKGYQIYIKHHGNPGGIIKLLKYKIEYRANNGYCVAPPSIHPNGEEYQFLGVHNYTELPQLIDKDVKSIFKDFKIKIGKAWNIEATKHAIKGTTKTDIENSYPKCVETALDQITKHPMRYYTIYGITSSFAMKNIPKDMAMKKIKEFNLKKCVPPHKNDIVEQAVNGAYEPNAHRYGCEFWMDHAELCPYENIMECPYGKKKAKRELAKQYKIFQYKEKQNKNGEKYLIRTGVNYTNLAELIINEYDYNFLTTSDTKEIYYYNDGYFHSKGENIVRSISEDFMENLSSKHAKNEVEDHVRDKNYQNRDIFDTPKLLIPLKNGVYDLKNNELLAHNPKYYFLNEIPVIYDGKADCPKIKKFLSEVADEKDINAIQEFFGYCLYREYIFHKAFMFVGSGKNGKSTCINLLKRFLGEKNVSNKELQELSYDRFATSKLYGKLLNAAADISDAALQQTGKFKTLTGNDGIDAQKKFQESFNFKNYAKLLYSANTLPKTDDDSYAFYRRWILINFSNVFEKEKCDPHILKKLTTPEELSGMLNYALAGLRRLLKNNGFSYSKTVEETREQYKTLSDPIYSFVQEFISTNTTGFLLKDDVYQKFLKWCKEKDLPTTPKNMFSQDLNKHIPNMRPGRKRVNGRQERVYNYICWKEGNPAQPPQQEELD